MSRFALFPCHSSFNGTCSCGRIDCRSPAKHPLTRNGFADASRDEGQWVKWLNLWPFANFGMPTGAANGVLVIDVDPLRDGLQQLEAFEYKHERLPETWRVRTGGGGLHLYFALHSGISFGSRNNWLPGVDVKCEGGYVIAPGSVHISGRKYEWARGFGPKDISIASVPMWLMTKLPPVVGITPSVKRERPQHSEYPGLRLSMSI